jgi:3-deoxy-manno-octulosonate cytidylyltransferase (CMP-KDO synthetase)
MLRGRRVAVAAGPVNRRDRAGRAVSVDEVGRALYDGAYTRAHFDLAIVAIIPARFGSTRLPGKPLSDIHGRPMVQWVHECVRRARRVDRILVATDDARIADAVARFGGTAVMTSSAHATGTDRLAEAAGRTDADVVVNVQGDEPMLDPALVDAVVGPLLDDPSLPMSTVSLPLRRPEEMLSPTVVKVVADARGRALYFSRSPIPVVRDGGAPDLPAAALRAVSAGLARKHVGLYAYRRDALLRIAALPPAPLETAEGLEQLRALHHGLAIQVVPCEGESGRAVDTPEDLQAVRDLLKDHADAMR